jgi:hypothetical protein
MRWGHFSWRLAKPPQYGNSMVYLRRNKIMYEMSTKKEHLQGRRATVSEENNPLLISSRLMADLKNKGIRAFKKMTDEEQKKVWKWSTEVIGEYRSVLEADPSNIRNIEDLPFPKEDIKLAIKLSLPLYISKDMHSIVKLLKTAYKDLGTFQLIEDADKKELLARASLKRRASSQNNKTIYPLADKYTQLAVSEQKALLEEINDFVTDLEAIKLNN